MKLPLLPVYIDHFNDSEGICDATYLLSHFHSDHMKGLSYSWNAGTILCDRVTRELVIQKYGPAFEDHTLPLQLLKPYPLFHITSKRSPTSLSSPHTTEQPQPHHTTDLTFDNSTNDVLIRCNKETPDEEADSQTVVLYLLPAFHIPGSVMFYFQTPFGSILYTGDFKYNERAKGLLDPFFATHPVDHVYVDDTWLHLGVLETHVCSNGNIGSRVLSRMLSERGLDEAIEALGRRMDKRMWDYSQTESVASGPYVLRIYLHNQFGKEHIVQRLSTRLGTRIFIDAERYKRVRLISTLQRTDDAVEAAANAAFSIDADRFAPFPPAEEDLDVFPRIEVVSSLRSITPEELRAATMRNKGTPFYGLVMSGWARMRRRDDDADVWEMPATLHCTPQEIIDFIALLRPASVTPLHYKPCRGAVVLERLGAHLRQPYVNRFLSAADRDARGMEFRKGCPARPPAPRRLHGGFPLCGGGGSVEGAASLRLAALCATAGQKRKRPGESYADGEWNQVDKEHDADKAKNRALERPGTILSQLAEMLDL